MVELSIVIPAYNEEARVPRTLAATQQYVVARCEKDVEVIVVDDGSSDATLQICCNMQRKWPQLRVVRHENNLGKGAAIRSGVLQALGKMILVMDADLSVRIDELEKLRSEIVAGADVAVGSRLLPDSHAQRTLLRHVLGMGFAWLVRRIFSLPVRDTQCGFKMFSIDAAKLLWRNVCDSRYLADLEILVRASQCNLVIKEVAVTYQDVPGSKISLWRDPWIMVFSLIALRRRLVGVQTR